mgnify:CR=1 FL=1
MTRLQFHNTESRSLEDFNPIKPGKVGMYHCGPTVYNRAHLGNLSPYIYWDVMRRLFEALDYKVTQVMNFTDVGHIVSDADQGDDKMVNALKQSGKELTIDNLHQHGKEIAEVYINDLTELNIKLPHHMPFASKHIDADIEIITKLMANDYTYTIAGDAIYFDTAKIDNYDHFQIHGQFDASHQRIVAKSAKRSPRDFSLWKFSSPGSDIGWDSPWGKGFPGWHIECSAMAYRYLGESFDIHTGGIEHIAIHHTNEIAQSESAFNKPMASYWLHSNHLQLNNQKIAKSDGNVLYLDEITAEGYDAMDFRYLLLTSHYRTEKNISYKILESARSARKSLYKLFADVSDLSPDTKPHAELIDIISKDLDTAQSLARSREILATDTDSKTKIAVYNFITHILGLSFSDLEQKSLISNINDKTAALLQNRKDAKKNKDYEQADAIRQQLESLGYRVVDKNDGSQVLYRK